MQEKLENIISYLVGNFFCAASGYSSQFSASEVFVVNIIGHLFKVLQVGSYQHVS